MKIRMKKGIGGILLALIMITSIAAVIPMAAVAAGPPGDGSGTGTPGYWKNHPEAWPVEEITIGDLTHTKEEAIKIMKTSGKGDKTYTMFRALVAANLNAINGNNPACIIETTEAADEWMTENPLDRGVKGKDSAWQEGGEALYLTLDAYNNGLFCAESRDVLEG